MSSPEVAGQAAIAEAAALLAKTVPALIGAGQTDLIPDADVQTLLIAAIRLYVARLEAGAELEPFGAEDVTATEVLVSAAAMLKAARLEVFELTMWNGFGTI